tara:strand:- start:2766 stop:3137 length:372 start_codon:yes stop_codon:yes gene_type:complete
MEDMDGIRKESGARLKKARKDASYTLALMEDASKGKISKSRIGNYEAGTRMMDVATAITIGQILGVSAAYLLVVDETSESASDGLNESQNKLLKLLSKVSKAGEDEIEFVSFMIKAYLVHRSK